MAAYASRTKHADPFQEPTHDRGRQALHPGQHRCHRGLNLLPPHRPASRVGRLMVRMPRAGPSAATGRRCAVCGVDSRLPCGAMSRSPVHGRRRAVLTCAMASFQGCGVGAHPCSRMFWYLVCKEYGANTPGTNHKQSISSHNHTRSGRANARCNGTARVYGATDLRGSGLVAGE